MLYLNKQHIEKIGIDWPVLIDLVCDASARIRRCDYIQPIKSYLRYGDRKNRIIAMPAYIGGKDALAGIKWISSFPANIERNQPRANSVTILNDAGTGVVKAIIGTSFVSEIRTATVSGTIIRKYIGSRTKEKYIIGIIGFGPIGRIHLRMMEALFPEKIAKVLLYDLKKIEPTYLEGSFSSNISICGSWEECYNDADIFLTCTVSDKPYINRAPKAGSLQMNVSLRDFECGMRKYMDLIIVDDWDEVCRENTDIYNMHREGLEKKDTVSIGEVLAGDGLDLMDGNRTVMFNPMGMAVFDVAVGGYYYDQARCQGVGTFLPE